MGWKRWNLSWIMFWIQIYSSSGAKPSLTSKSDDIIKAVGYTVNMSCKFSSATDITITWLKDGKSINFDSNIFTVKLGGTMQMLNIKKLTATEGGTYTCVATNIDGKAVGNIKVDVIQNYKPKIYNLPDVYLKDGQNYATRCKADALPDDVTYSWRYNNGKVDGVSIIVINSNLEIKKMAIGNVGNYTCIATNKMGSTNASFALKRVESTIWVKQPKATTVSTTQEFEFVASIATLRTAPVFRWYKDGNDLLRKQSSVTHEGSLFTSKLKFPDLNLGDDGKYRVSVENLEVGGFESDMVLTVLAPPSVQIYQGTEMRLEVGDTLLLICTAQAKPAPKIQWIFNNTVLTSMPANGTKTLKYLKANVKTVDSGKYFCNASNEQGKGSFFINLIVDSPGLSYAVKVTVIVVVSILFIMIIVGGAFLYCRYGERCLAARLDEGAFYTDLVEEEKDVSCLADIENNPNTLKKNINMSMKRPPLVSVSDGGGRKQSLFKTISGQSTKGNKTLARQQSIFDTIRTNQPAPRKGSLFDTLKTMSVRGRSLSLPENHYAVVGSYALCQGKSIEFKRIILDEIIGSGEYGLVTKGRLLDDDDVNYHDISIKMLKEGIKPQEKRNMLAEIRIMRRIPTHANLVEFIGWCIASPNVYIIEEDMPFGNLLDFLRAQRRLQCSNKIGDGLLDEIIVDESMLLSYARQIASGMMHLASLQVVHRDLACRNIYIGYENIVKISDYALIRDIYAENVYRKTTGGQLPVRWMAYEAIFRGEYSVKSDVWSFGILLWELVMLGKIPYPGIVRTEQLLEELESGYNMEKPDHVSTDLYLMMDSCWYRKPESRQGFSTMYAQLTTYLHDEESDVVHIDLTKLAQTENKSAPCEMIANHEDHRVRSIQPQIKEDKEEEEEDDYVINDREPLA